MAKKSKTTKKSLNETGRRNIDDDRRSEKAKEDAATTTSERRKTKRRRQIDPTTCEREYNDAEIEFMHALDEYKRASGRMFPTCSEILEVITGLGYRKVTAATEGFSFEQNDEDDASFGSDSDFDEESLETELEDQMI